MYCTPPETRTARKPRRCMNCGEMIETGTKYKRWMSVDDGKANTNAMHPEFLDDLNEAYGSGYFEYTLYSGERPNAINEGLDGALSASPARLEG